MIGKMLRVLDIGIQSINFEEMTSNLGNCADAKTPSVTTLYTTTFWPIVIKTMPQ